MCDECCDQYNIFPSMIFGGGPGDYEIECPVRSCKWAEYRILQVSNSSSAASLITISGDNPKLLTLPYTGTLITLSDDAFLRGEAYSVGTSDTKIGSRVWQRITHSQRRVFARIDTTGSGAAFITVQFRVRVLDRIPGPIEAVSHPDLGQQVNIERAKRTNDRLVKAGIPERFH